MADAYDEDLFEGTKMTFAEHLEELRQCLFRAVIGLVIGFLIGLLLARHVVRGIQAPLRRALEDYYANRTMARIDATYPNLSPEERSRIESAVRQRHLTLETVYADPSELRHAINATGTPVNSAPPRDADASPGSDAPPSATGTDQPPAALPDPTKLVALQLWRRLSPKVTALSTQESFMIWVKAAFVTGIILASPYMFWQIWIFVAAGLYPHEKRYVYIFLPISATLFWSGVVLAFFVVFRYVLQFLLNFNLALDIEAEPRISEWIGMVLFMPLGFGVAFQLPLVMLFLERIGIVTTEQYLSHWRVAVAAIAFVSMIFTPQDPVSMILMGLPLVGLYFLGVGFCKWMPRGRSPFKVAYEP
ncbi:MAG TPA: twin-arginine translocase subunit TatC [Bryobacterales bacterium]|nr:twin-arginine translocase subunit TatC [Bryobacterales bacterium]